MRFFYLLLILVTLLMLGGNSSDAAAQSNTPGPVLLYSDLESGPSQGGANGDGVYVTLYGERLGAQQGHASITVGGALAKRVLFWNERRIVVQLDSSARSGEIQVTDATGRKSSSLPFTVRPGRIRFVAVDGNGDGSFENPMSPVRAAMGLQPGDTLYFRAGLYNGGYASPHWGQWNYALGRAQAGARGRPVAFVGFPGEEVIFSAPGLNYGNFGLRDNQALEERADYVTIANLTLRGADVCVGGGGITTAASEQAKSGARGVRLIGNKCSARYRGNTMTGLIAIANDGWRVYGNEFHDTGTTPPINNNHAVYVVVGASDTDIGWNYFHHLKMGHVIQVHTDSGFRFDRVKIHSNVISAERPQDCRGINIGHVRAGSSGTIYNNVLMNLGQNFSAIAIYGGHWRVFNNTLVNIHASNGMLWLSGQYGEAPTAEVFNNIFVSDGRSPYVTTVAGANMHQLALSNNLYFNGGRSPASDSRALNVDPRLISKPSGLPLLSDNSPAVGRGLSVPGPEGLMDLSGATRSQTDKVDLGALQRRPL